MSDAWRVELAPAARRDLRRLDPHVRRLTGIEAEWRLRVGDWRVRFTRELTTHTVYVLRVLPRGRGYRD